jgi:hypothetical protein
MKRKQSGTTKFGPKGKRTVKHEMHKYKHGELHSGKSGRTVKSRKQAIAIALSEGRKASRKK